MAKIVVIFYKMYPTTLKIKKRVALSNQFTYLQEYKTTYHFSGKEKHEVNPKLDNSFKHKLFEHTIIYNSLIYVSFVFSI